MPPEAIEVAVTAALESGYRHIDTAFTYGNEEAIGKTLKKWFDKGGKREDLFITTKVQSANKVPTVSCKFNMIVLILTFFIRRSYYTCLQLPPIGMRAEYVENYLKLSLEKLDLEYVNMYLIHKPFAFVKDKYKYEPAMNPDGSVVIDADTDHVAIWKVRLTFSIKKTNGIQ